MFETCNNPARCWRVDPGRRPPSSRLAVLFRAVFSRGGGSADVEVAKGPARDVSVRRCAPWLHPGPAAGEIGQGIPWQRAQLQCVRGIATLSDPACGIPWTNPRPSIYVPLGQKCVMQSVKALFVTM